MPRSCVALHREAIERAAGRTALDALDAADAEDALLERLEALGIPEPWRIAEPLAAAGVDEAWLEQVATLAGPATDAALAWAAATLTAHSLAAELQEATQRMSSLVGAVKSYAYMDRGDVVEVDLHEGLETTLIVLGHQLKHTAIQVVRDYDRSLPKLTVRGSELNQVWTNLLENAIDALGESGTITITTRVDGDCAAVDIADDGPGIPAEIRERVFDSFFTTKEIGSGTGLGLATALSHRRRPPRRGADRRIRAGPDRLPRPASTRPELRSAVTMPICTHLDTVNVTQLPYEVDGCEDCLAIGGLWLHLRICLECGHVGCCDDSPNRHATAHAPCHDAPAHPLARAGRGLVVVLHGRGGPAHPDRAGHDADPAVAAARLGAVSTPGRRGACAPRSGRSARRARRAALRRCRTDGSSSRCRHSGARAWSAGRARRRSCCSGRASGGSWGGSRRSSKASLDRAARRRLSYGRTLGGRCAFPGRPRRRCAFPGSDPYVRSA